MAAFSIPKRVSEVLWLAAMLLIDLLQKSSFQSLKGFQRFCGNHGQVLALYTCHFSIPKRVSEVLWQSIASINQELAKLSFSIPKRVSEVLWPK